MDTPVNSQSQSSPDRPIPQPGEIWTVNRQLQSPLELPEPQHSALYSDIAQKFLAGTLPPRLVMVVLEPEPPIDPEGQWQVISVMVLSEKTQFLNPVDVGIPADISGVGYDLLAETWHVQPMLACNLSHPIGQRLSRKRYDALMTIGDYYHGLTDDMPSPQEIEALGFKIAERPFKHPEIEAFHHEEMKWSDVLSVPLAAYYTYLKAIGIIDAILEEALQLERDFATTSSEEEE